MATFGIDISRWQGDFNFAKAKAEGVEFAIIKCGGADDGLYTDSKFIRNCTESSKNGMKIGAYYFGHARNVAEAKKEAEHCISIIKGHSFSYPIYYDVESSVMNVGKSNLDAIIHTFCEVLEAAGYFAGVYMNYDWYRNKCNGAELAKRFTFWIASWSKTKPVECDMWQFGGETNVIRSNKVTGITVDQNYCYKDFATQIKEKGLNGFVKPTATAKPTATTKPVSAPKPTSALKSNVEIAKEVITGKWGDGSTMKTKLKNAGYNPSDIEWVVAQMKAGKQFDPKTGKIITPAVPTLKVGDKVKLSSSATYYNGGFIPSWVKNSTLYLRSLDGDRAVISTVAVGDITGVVNKKYLTKA